MTALIARLQEAACAAISQERPALESPAGHVRGVTIELLLSGTGDIHEAVAFLETEYVPRPQGWRLDAADVA